MAGHSFRVSLAGEALLPSLMVWSLTVSRVCFSRESAGAEWAACGRAYAGGGSGGVRGVFCHKKSYKVLGCLEPWQPSCSRKGKKRILMEEWVAGFGKREGKGQLSVSTLIGAGKGAGASALSWAAPRVRGQQKAGSRVWGAEPQGAKQLLLWHKGSEGTPIRRVSQAARAWRWVSWRCGPARSPVQGPRRLHSHL